MKLPTANLMLLCTVALLLLSQVYGCPRRRGGGGRPSPSCIPRSCVVSSWSSWGDCSHRCGSTGVKTSYRYIIRSESCGGSCPGPWSKSVGCNRNRNLCKNYGRPIPGRCSCISGWTGTCCEYDVNECNQGRPCQHICINWPPGRYRCRCYSCYTPYGTRCRLQRCKINGGCYRYGAVNPYNQCQDCHSSRKTSWRNNNALHCSDKKLCTRNDKCHYGVCIGTPFTCLSCESCDGHGCTINPGFCVIDGKCYRHGDLRPEKPCQECNSNRPRTWTANNNLLCSDNNAKTRNDRCTNGECRGEPFTCLSCQDHHNDVCRRKTGYCIITQNNVDTCFNATTEKPGNPCQWCLPEASIATWTKKHDNVSCDDGYSCTKSDTCKQGQCEGISFTCHSNCQSCNGTGCSLNAGYGYVAGKCTCKIGGRDYSHQQLNPNNECHVCDIYDKTSKSSSTWSNRPSVLCNDNNTCTIQDICQNGYCRGTEYSCQTSYPLSSCIQSSECNGDGTCRNVMKINGTICRTAADRCDQPERCNGVLGTCPPIDFAAIHHQEGQASLTRSNFASSIAFQSNTDKLHLKLSGFSVTCGSFTVKWSLIKHEESCLLTERNKTLPSNTSNHILTDLNLRDMEKYKIVVRASNIRGQFGLPVCSNPVTIDTSTPTGGWVNDGSGSTDLQYQSSKSFTASWGGFQSKYGIGKYEVAMHYQQLSSNDRIELRGFRNVNLNVSFGPIAAAIPDGSNITTEVRAYSKAGLYTETASNGVILDTSQPLPGLVSDGLNISFDLDYAEWTTSYKASWEPFTDPHTPIVNYNIGVKKRNGGFVSSGLTAVGMVHQVVIPGLALVSEEEYCAIVEGENAAGLKAEIHSNCLLIDHDSPRPGTVNDGVSDDIDYQSDDTAFYANWKGFNDGVRGSGLAEYKYILTDQNDVNVTSWISVGMQTNVTILGIDLVDRTTYYITVRAIDRVGHYKNVKSNGVYIDMTHPVYTGEIIIKGETTVKDNKTFVYIQNIGTVTASWPQFLDAHSGMQKFQWSIVKDSEEPTEWKDVPGINLATNAVFRSLALVDNIGYRLVIRGINNAGLHSHVRSAILIPIRAPAIGNVSDGHDLSVDADYLTNTSEVHATWQGFETTDVKIRAYFFAIGSCTKGNYHVTKNQFITVTPPSASSFGIHGLRLVNGQRYCVKIQAENLAGAKSEIVSSDGFIVDNSPPNLRHAMVLDGQGEDDIDYQSSNTQLSATWAGIKDYESGIQHFEVAVSRNRAGQPDVTSFTDVGHNVSSTIKGLYLNNEVHYIILCAINNAGLRSCLASDGVLIDPTPPSSGVVHDGILEPDVRYQAAVNELSANWERIWDLESRVERFEWAIAEKGEDLVQEFVNVGLQTHVTTKKILELKHAHNYTVLLRVYNRAGLLKELSSNGVVIDTTPPVPTEIVPGLSQSEWRFSEKSKTHYSSNASDFYVTWKNFEELESEIWYYKWAIGTSKYGTQLQPLINIGLATNANTSGNGLRIRPGIRYFVTVVGRNRADLVSGSCSWPFIFDYSPPRTGAVQTTSPSGIKKKYFRSDENIRAIWSVFEDLESGIEKYELSVVHNNTEILKYTVVSTDAKLELLINTSLLISRIPYKIVVKATNHAGLESAISSPFTIDDTPPFYPGDKHKLPKRHFLSDPHLLEISWNAFEDDESPIEFYDIGIGRHASSDDFYKFTKTDLRTHFTFSDLDIIDNQSYYVTINAHNLAGFVTSLLLEEIIFDQSPPSGNNQSVKDGPTQEDINYMSLQDTVSASLENIEDSESGIRQIEYCVGTTPFNCFLKPFTSNHQNRSFICMECKIDAGMNVFAIFRVTNGAGLSSIFTSDGVTVDASPPEIQSLYDGKKPEYPDVEKTYSIWTPTVTWYGARDVQSGLRYCDWTIIKKDGNTTISVYVKILHKSNITYNVRHSETAAGPLTLTENASYFNVIQCWNHAGISSRQYSNGWSVVEQWPIPTFVIDGKGPHDMKYDVNGKSIEASWGAFRADSKDPVVKYEWAVGTFGKIDNIVQFTDVGLDTKVSLLLSESDVTLKPGVEYYITVRGTTWSGWTANKTSNGFILDTTSPKAGIVTVSHHIVDQNISELDYTLSWEGFVDSETEIQRYAYCLGYIRNVCSTSVFNAGLDFLGTVRGFRPEDLDNPFFGIVVATNGAGLETVVSSDPVKIDFTPPVTGTVSDGNGIDLDYLNSSVPLATTWSAFKDPESDIKKCTLTIREENPIKNKSATIKFKKNVNGTGSIIHDFPVTSGLRYFATVTCENKDGFISSKASDGAIVDDTPPIPGKILDKNRQPFENQYQSSTSELHVCWTDSYDRESGILEYFIAVGSGSSQDNIRQFLSVGLARTVIVKNLTMSSDSTYYVTLEIVNKAGITSRVSSNGITVDTTPPEINEIKLQRPETENIGPKDSLTGNWKTSDEESGIEFAEYCFGTTRDACNVQDMRRAQHNETNTTCINCKLKDRYTYFMTVRVWNKAGLFSVATSEGVTVDLTAPVKGKVSINKTHTSCVGRCSLTAEFSGFEDDESGLGTCEFSVKTIDEEAVIPVQPTTNEYELEAKDLTLQHDQSYKIAVACYNTLAERSLDAFSPPIRIDNTPPVKGSVIVSPDRNHDVRHEHVGCHFFNTSLRVHWSGFYDKESKIAGFRVAIGRRPHEPDVIPYTSVGIVTDAMFGLGEQYGLSLGETIFATVEATNKAGLTAKVASPPTRLISDTDSNLINEQDFLCVIF